MGRKDLHPGFTLREKTNLRHRTFHTYFRSYLYDSIKARCSRHPGDPVFVDLRAVDAGLGCCEICEKTKGDLI